MNRGPPPTRREPWVVMFWLIYCGRTTARLHNPSMTTRAIEMLIRRTVSSVFRPLVHPCALHTYVESLPTTEPHNDMLFCTAGLCSSAKRWGVASMQSSCWSWALSRAVPLLSTGHSGGTLAGMNLPGASSVRRWCHDRGGCLANGVERSSRTSPKLAAPRWRSSCEHISAM